MLSEKGKVGSTKEILERIYSMEKLVEYAKEVLVESLEGDRLVFLDRLVMEIKSGNEKILDVLRELHETEEDPLERLVYGSACGSDIRDMAFLPRVYVYTRYPDVFKNMIYDFEKHASPREALLNIIFLAKHENTCFKEDVVCELLRRVDRNDTGLLLPFVKDHITEKQYIHFLDGLDTLQYCAAVTRLRKDMYYDSIAKRILGMSIKDVILLANTLGLIDNCTLYKHVLKMFTAEYSKECDFNLFIRFNELFKILKMDDESVYRILFAWMRVFIAHKMFEHFLLVFFKVNGYKDSEASVYKSFYECICNYKTNGTFNFDLFVNVCLESAEPNEFATMGLEELCRAYKF